MHIRTCTYDVRTGACMYSIRLQHKRRAKTNELESGRVDKNARDIMIWTVDTTRTLHVVLCGLKWRGTSGVSLT